MTEFTGSIYIKQIGVEQFKAYLPEKDLCYKDDGWCLRCFDTVIQNPSNPPETVQECSQGVDDLTEWLEVTVDRSDGFWEVDIPDRDKSSCYDDATPSVALSLRLNLPDSPIDQYTPPEE